MLHLGTPLGNIWLDLVKHPLSWKMKEESEKAGLKLNIQKAKIMTSGTITSWQIEGETMEAVTDIISWALTSLQIVNAAMKSKELCSLEEKI